MNSKYQLVTVSPTLAEKWLTKNNANRKMSEFIVRKYADSMMSGSFAFDGSPIKFADDGSLLDGQHRLAAVVKSKISQKFLVVKGLPEETMFVLDIGRKRTFGDVLTIKGIPKYAELLAATIKHLRVYYGANLDNLSHISLFQYYEANQDIYDSLLFVLNTDTGKKVGGYSHLAACHFILSKINKEEANVFITQIITGEQLQKTQPMFYIREKLIELKYKRIRPFENFHFILIFEGWNRNRKNQKTKHIAVLPNMKIPQPL